MERDSHKSHLNIFDQIRSINLKCEFDITSYKYLMWGKDVLSVELLAQRGMRHSGTAPRKLAEVRVPIVKVLRELWTKHT